MTYTLYCGDCLQIMPTLEAHSVDCILADWPYGTTQAAWDTLIPFDEMWEVCEYVLKPTGQLVLFSSQPFTSKLVMSKFAWFRQEIIWDKVLGVGFLDANRRHLRRHENILIFSPIGYPTFNPQMVIRGKKRNKGRKNGNSTILYGNHKPVTSYNNEYFPTSILSFTNGDRNTDEDGHHPTQKDLSLMRYLVRTYTNPGDLILDNTMGSGSTGVAALLENRRFIGIELMQEYFDIATSRLEYTARLLRKEYKPLKDNGKSLADLPMFSETTP